MEKNSYSEKNRKEKLWKWYLSFDTNIFLGKGDNFAEYSRVFFNFLLLTVIL